MDPTINLDAPPLDEADAMTITIHATNAFVALSADPLPKEVLHGIVLFYDALMQQAAPLLPRTETMAYIREQIAKAHDTAAMIRARHDLPARM